MDRATPCAAASTYGWGRVAVAKGSDPARSDTRGPVHARVCYAPSHSATPLFSYSGGLRGVADGKRRSRQREGALTRRAPTIATDNGFFSTRPRRRSRLRPFPRPEPLAAGREDRESQAQEQQYPDKECEPGQGRE